MKEAQQHTGGTSSSSASTTTGVTHSSSQRKILDATEAAFNSSADVDLSPGRALPASPSPSSAAASAGNGTHLILYFLLPSLLLLLLLFQMLLLAYICILLSAQCIHYTRICYSSLRTYNAVSSMLLIEWLEKRLMIA